jgi:DNA-binding CsgD family transcriptional regulator
MNDFIFKQIRNNWSSFIKEPSDEKYDLDIIKQFPFLEYFEGNKIAYSIMNNTTFEMVHSSDNFWDVLGIDRLKHEKSGAYAITAQTAESHLSLYTLLPRFFLDYWETVPDDKKKDINRTTVGLNFNHKDKGKIRLVIQIYILEVNSILEPTYIFAIYHDITYMMKDDFFWLRFSNIKDTEEHFVYHDGLKEVLKDDIFSKREKEILRLIIEGKSTDEIAGILFISKATVNNHRQNMLNRIGVKDTTGLITLTKLCKLV